jgi:hypothetical protein
MPSHLFQLRAEPAPLVCDVVPVIQGEATVEHQTQSFHFETRRACAAGAGILCFNVKAPIEANLEIRINGRFMAPTRPILNVCSQRWLPQQLTLPPHRLAAGTNVLTLHGDGRVSVKDMVVFCRQQA